LSTDNDIFRLIVEQTRDYAVFALDRQGRVMTWNAGAERLKGYRADEIIGRHFSTFYTREAIDRGWPGRELELAAATGRLEDEGWRVRKDGSQFWANVVITALRGEDGELLGYSKITRDLTERKGNEEALRQSEERFRLLVEGVTDYAIYMLSEDGIITSWNAGAERMKGLARGEVIGTHFSRFYLDEDRGTKPWEELALGRRVGRAESEGWQLRKSGERFWARIIVTALHDDTGKLRGFAKVTQDLSERRHAQTLEQAAKQVSEFIAVLAHELRNPLAPIRNALHILNELPAGDPRYGDLHKIIERQSAQLVRIVDDLLDMSRIARGLLSVSHDPVDLADVIQRSIETATPLFDAHRHHVRVDQPTGAVVVAGDLVRLTQVVGNLLNNAARYTADGGHIRVVLAKEGTTAIIRVIDNGHGIAPAAIDAIFDMFVREHSAPGPAPGLGIGLALARKIAELHGGTLMGFSEGVGKGAEFVLRLPLLAAEGVASNYAEGAQPLPEMHRRRVMIVDDNADAAWVLQELTKELGHETLVLNSGAEALQAVHEFRPDVILLDIGMPGMSGLEVAKRLRADGLGNIRLVAVTGWGQDRDRERSRDAGFDFHLAKPIDLEDLISVLSAGRPRS
jgi:PAS domain S-box-containing protein